MITFLLLIACGPSSSDIVSNLASINPVVREDTAKIARNFGSDAVEAALISVLDDPEPKVRAHAVDSLIELECVAAVAPLAARLEHETDPMVVRLVVDALGRLGEIEAVPALVAYLETRLDDPPLNAIWALGALEDHRALPVLAGLRSSSDPFVVWNVNQALRALRPGPPPAG
jgi:HEAT repeat protein